MAPITPIGSVVGGSHHRKNDNVCINHTVAIGRNKKSIKQAQWCGDKRNRQTERKPTIFFVESRGYGKNWGFIPDRSKFL
jgi:hypothetical protein